MAISHVREHKLDFFFKHTRQRGIATGSQNLCVFDSHSRVLQYSYSIRTNCEQGNYFDAEHEI